MTTRRERYRTATINEIKQAALDQIRRVGAANLSLREIGRQIGMSPAGLYRYYEGRDALLTDLIVDAYQALAEAVEDAVAGAGDETEERLLAAARAYRSWALENRRRFMLIFGTPIPGYAAPEGGPTVAAVQRLGTALGKALEPAVASGAINPEEWDYRPTPRLEELCARMPEPYGSPPAVQLVLALWAGIHGPVSLEVLGHLDWGIGDLDRFFSDGVRRLWRSCVAGPE